MLLRLNASGVMTVAGLVPEGAADRTGQIRLHDTLLAIDGVPVQSLDLSRVTHMLQGPVGTEVRVTLSRVGAGQYTVRFARLPPTPSSMSAAQTAGARSEAARQADAANFELQVHQESLAAAHIRKTVRSRMIKSWRNEVSRQKVVRNTCVTLLLQETRAKAAAAGFRAWTLWLESKRISRATSSRFQQISARLRQSARRAEREAMMTAGDSQQQKGPAMTHIPAELASGGETDWGAGREELLQRAEAELVEARAANARLVAEKEKLAAECDRLQMDCQRQRKAAGDAQKEVARLRVWQESAEERVRENENALVGAQHEHAQVVLVLQSEREAHQAAEKEWARERERAVQRAQSQPQQHVHACGGCGHVQVLWVEDEGAEGTGEGGKWGEEKSDQRSGGRRKLAKLCHCACEARFQEALVAANQEREREKGEREAREREVARERESFERNQEEWASTLAQAQDETRVVMEQCAAEVEAGGKLKAELMALQAKNAALQGELRAEREGREEEREGILAQMTRLKVREQALQACHYNCVEQRRGCFQPITNLVLLLFPNRVTLNPKP